MTGIRVAAAAIAVAAVSGAAMMQAGGAVPVFPAVSGENLNGKRFSLPADFQGPASFVAIAFAREQQTQVDGWLPAIKAARARVPALGGYEVPVLSRGVSLFRGFINGGMRRGIPDTATRATTITLYIDKRPFDESLAIATEAEITVLLVKPDGTILWRASGPCDAAKTAGLDAVLAALGS
jgi:hypothetical protein